MEASASRFDQVVSLGCSCQPAYQIRRLLSQEEAQVFDWLITEDGGLIHLIEGGASDLFERDDLKWIDGAMRSQRHGTRFLHECPTEGDFETAYDAHRDRLGALAARWRSLMASDARILFVRVHAWDADPRRTAARLYATLEQAGPRLKFDLLYLTPPYVFDPLWSDASIIHRPIFQPEPYTWRGDDAAWEEVLREAGALG